MAKKQCLAVLQVPAAIPPSGGTFIDIDIGSHLILNRIKAACHDQAYEPSCNIMSSMSSPHSQKDSAASSLSALLLW